MEVNMMFRCCTLVALLACCAAQPLHAADIDKFLPADTAVVLRLDVKSMRDTPALQDDKEALQKGRAFIDRVLLEYDAVRKHMTSAGIDVYRDIATITTAMPGDGDPDKAFVVLEGTFDPARFRKTAEAEAAKPDSGLKLVKIAGHDVVQVDFPGREEPLYAFLVDKSTLLGAGSRAKIETALKQIDNDKAEPAKDVRALVQQLDAKQHFGFAGTRTAMAKLLERSNQPFGDVFGQIFEGADNIQGGLTLGKECTIVFRFTARDEKSAKQFFQNTTFALAAVRGLVAKRAKEDAEFVPLAELLKELRTGLEGTTVVWRSKVSLASADKLVRNLTK
jgi:hypothetical protein